MTPTPCPICGQLVTDSTRKLHLVWRKFTNWSGTWRNSVICDGKTVAGQPLDRS